MRLQRQARIQRRALRVSMATGKPHIYWTGRWRVVNGLRNLGYDEAAREWAAGRGQRS